MSKSAVRQFASSVSKFSPLLLAGAGVFIVSRYAAADPVLLCLVFLLSAARHAFLVWRYEWELRVVEDAARGACSMLANAREDLQFQCAERQRAEAAQQQWRQLVEQRRKVSEEGLAAGRAEALHFLLSLNADDIDDYIGSKQAGGADDYYSYWHEDKLRKLFRVSAENVGNTESYIQQLENELYWRHAAEVGEESEELEDDAPVHSTSMQPEESVPVPRPSVLWLRRGVFLAACLTVGALLGFACLICAAALYLFSVVVYDTDHSSLVAAGQQALLFLFAAVAFSSSALGLELLARKMESSK